MKKIFCFVLCFYAFGTKAETVFIAQEGDIILASEGAVTSQYSPCSTFKIALALMGFDSGILKDETDPSWPYQEGYVDYLESWKQPHDPTSWIKNSCIWFSQVITSKLGAEKFRDYVQQLSYGNQEAENHLNCWLSSTLKISPREQIDFLKKLTEDKLPFSKHTQELTRKILYVGECEGWKLFGKTGSGRQEENKELGQGWFIGWLEKGDRRIVFTYYKADETPEREAAGLRAKPAALEKLKGLLT